MKSANRADSGFAAATTFALALAVAVSVSAQSRTGGTSPQPAWFACAGAGPGDVAVPVRRLTALTDKGVVEADVATVFAQREKEQRVSAANLAKARLSIDFVYAAGDGGAPMYYYEASKTIPDAEGLLRVSVSGWLRGDGRPPRSLGSKSELQWIELADDPGDDLEVIPNPAPIPDPTAALVPVGVLANARAHVWVMRRAIGNGTPLVYEVGSTGVRLRPASPRCKS